MTTRIKNSKFEIRNSHEGFTLIELVVVMSLFMLILGVTVTIFISIIRQQKRVLAEQELLSQVSYAQEYISQHLQQAQNDVSGTCLVDTAGNHAGFWYLLTHYNQATKSYEGIKFVNNQGDCQEIFFNQESRALRVQQAGQPAQDLLSAALNLQSVKFIINGDKSLFGATNQDAQKSRVSVLINALIASNGNQQEKHFQFTVSQKN